MNIHEAINSGLPFSNPDMIGAYCVYRYNDKSVPIHRDYIYDFSPDNRHMNEIESESHYNSHVSFFKECFSVEDLMRDDWYTIEF